jgi:hypothetical protein
MEEKVILRVKKENLIEWYFDNWDRYETHMLLKQIKEDILMSGEYILRIEEIADKVGYLPSRILEGKHDKEEYYVWDEIVLI